MKIVSKAFDKSTNVQYNIFPRGGDIHFWMKQVPVWGIYSKLQRHHGTKSYVKYPFLPSPRENRYMYINMSVILGRWLKKDYTSQLKIYQHIARMIRVRVNISVISRRSILLVEETNYPEKTIDLSQVTNRFQMMLYRVDIAMHLAMSGIQTHNARNGAL